ncbi:MAG: Re/Si-specific NAD(P)(+) transhydrogenase subunit alpha [Bacteroidetes bacterium]|nr:Re/Si-specific NAD(P)(+) transhydrogenase subunit alpha [Bacteroidota bacterium]
MKIGVLKETKANERRVALTPVVVKSLISKGYKIFVEKGAGMASAFSDESYSEAGAQLNSLSEVISNSEILLGINPPEYDLIKRLNEGKVWISLLYHKSNIDLIKKMSERKISTFSMDAIPRISRAQNMDVLSSQANLGGYKAVILGANELGKIFPLMMTAAGTITPARVLIFGVGVAGLQAIATAKRLGAVVEATDVRPETKEQAESLGAKFIQVEESKPQTNQIKDTIITPEALKKFDESKSEGGYAKEVSEDYKQRQKEAVNTSLRQADLVITTALVPGKKAPLLITEEQVKQMKLGSVIVDMAAEQGGNCELTKTNEILEIHGVKIIGKTNLPGELATVASELYAKNISAFISHLSTSVGFKWEMEEEITKATLIIKDGKILNN